MSNNSQHIKYTLADIENYLQNKLSNAERHTLEKAALTDPLLADAIEGYSIANLQQAKNYLASTENLIKAAANNNTSTQHNFTITEIEKYFSNQLSNTERHALEKAALTDPFLADAIEGYEIANLTKAKNYINETAQAIKNKEAQKAKVVAMPSRNKQWLRIAAGIILMIGAGTTIWWMNQKPVDTIKPIAKVTNTEATTNSITTTETPKQTENSTAKNSTKENTLTNKNTTSIKNLNNDLAIVSNEQGGLSNLKSKEEETAIKKSDVIIKSDVGSAPTIRANAAEAMVSNNDNIQSEKANFKKTTSNAITQSNEAINTGIAPEGGWNAFDSYVENKKAAWKIIDETAEKTIITFNIDNEGKPYQIKISDSSTLKLNRAIELITNGPKWIATNKAVTKVTLSIKL